VDPESAVGEEVHELVREAVKLTHDELFDDAIETFETHLAQLASGSLQDKRLAATAFSYYGLCVAMVKRRYSEAVKYCQISLRSNSFDPDHRYNLAKVYLERGDRRKAVETLNAGLKLDRRHRGINAIFDEIGRRRPPVIPFLRRDSFLNILLGKKFRRPSVGHFSDD